MAEQNMRPGETGPLQTPIAGEITEPLLDWYASHARKLPWRADADPYHIWISEIMLQQTRIEAAIPYYQRFIAELPDIRSLAAVDDERLMKLWEGLGYYSRARNLKKAAQEIVERYAGVMPADYEALLGLSGVGTYTAGAIASLAFGLPEPAVDGNVLRVLMRLTGDDSDILRETTRKRVRAELRQIYPSGARAAAMTQALMELGQTVCIPHGTPRCRECPWGAFCRARAEDRTGVLPIRNQKTKRTVAEKTVLLLHSEGKVAIRKREATGLLAGLWEFPSVDGFVEEEEVRAFLLSRGCMVKALEPAVRATHVFTHREWHMESYWVELERPVAEGGFLWVPETALDSQYALPSAFRAFREYLRMPFDCRK